jgi:hypothetical protein
MRPLYYIWRTRAVVLIPAPDLRRKTRVAILLSSLTLRRFIVCDHSSTIFESSQSFNKLSVAVERGSRKSSSVAREALQNFFRRSRVYLELHDGHKADPNRFFELLWSGIVSHSTKVTRLSLLENVGFESKALDFGSFKIRKFTKEELDDLVDSRTRDVFYPWSKIDTSMVGRFWLIVEETITHGSHLSLLSSADETESELDPSAIEERSDDATQRHFPERLIQLLSLYHWPYLDEETYHQLWQKYIAPFSFTFDDNILTPPEWVNRVPTSVEHEVKIMLDRELDFAAWKEEFPNDDVPGWYPPPEYNFDIELNSREELSLKSIVNKGEKILKIVELVEGWSFIEIAMGYLGRAFVTPVGLDQILWHVGALEALLSEENAVRQTMLRRMINILAATNADKTSLRKRFDKIYEFRSQLVHGKKYSKKAEWRHLNDARELAREVLLWFIDYLLRVDERLRKRNIKYEDYPKRGELVAILDFDRPSLGRLDLVIGTLPKKFSKIGGK